MPHLPNIRRLELHITYRCNLKCTHCHNLIAQAPSNETMPFPMIAWLMDESIRANHKWEWLVLHGGEPTLHPQFDDICRGLASYRDKYNPEVKLFLVTNGFAESSKRGQEVARACGIQVENTEKDGNPLVLHHIPYCDSPTDRGEPFSLGCHQTSKCGLGFNGRGFFCCSPLAAASRLFGYHPQARMLKDVTVENMQKGFLLHCHHCGYARGDGEVRSIMPDPRAPMTKTWLDAIARYHENQG